MHNNNIILVSLSALIIFLISLFIILNKQKNNTAQYIAWHRVLWMAVAGIVIPSIALFEQFK